MPIADNCSENSLPIRFPPHAVHYSLPLLTPQHFISSISTTPYALHSLPILPHHSICLHPIPYASKNTSPPLLPAAPSGSQCSLSTAPCPYLPTTPCRYLPLVVSTHCLPPPAQQAFPRPLSLATARCPAYCPSSLSTTALAANLPLALPSYTSFKLPI